MSPSHNWHDLASQLLLLIGRLSRSSTASVRILADMLCPSPEPADNWPWRYRAIRACPFESDGTRVHTSF
jgi:hypothetical protein